MRGRAFSRLTYHINDQRVEFSSLGRSVTHIRKNVVSVEDETSVVKNVRASTKVVKIQYKEPVMARVEEREGRRVFEVYDPRR